MKRLLIGCMVLALCMFCFYGCQMAVMLPASIIQDKIDERLARQQAEQEKLVDSLLKNVDTEQTVVQKMGKPTDIYIVDEATGKKVYEFRLARSTSMIVFRYDEDKNASLLKDKDFTANIQTLEYIDKCKKDEKRFKDFLYRAYPILKEQPTTKTFSPATPTTSQSPLSTFPPGKIPVSTFR